jgi:beta-phosphoglucomutase-like phosphatase (HAD superfamily)
MPRTARTLTAAPHYVTASTGGRHQVTDRVNGYALSEHADPDAADRAAQLLNTDPAAAVAAVRALDDTQTGPAAHVRRTLRRYGYRWSLIQSEATGLHS